MLKFLLMYLISVLQIHFTGVHDAPNLIQNSLNICAYVMLDDVSSNNVQINLLKNNCINPYKWPSKCAGHGSSNKIHKLIGSPFDVLHKS